MTPWTEPGEAKKLPLTWENEEPSLLRGSFMMWLRPASIR